MAFPIGVIPRGAVRSALQQIDAVIGAAHGGIWETRNSGKTWEPRTDDQFSLTMG